MCELQSFGTSFTFVTERGYVAMGETDLCEREGNQLVSSAWLDNGFTAMSHRDGTETIDELTCTAL